MKINAVYHLKPRPDAILPKEWPKLFRAWKFIGSMSNAEASTWTTGKDPKKYRIVPLDTANNMTAAQADAAVATMECDAAMAKVDDCLTPEEKAAIGL